MATLLCHLHPYLRVYNPVTGDYAQFAGGKLDIEPSDPNYAVVMTEASTNPSISILEMVKGGLSCPECGKAFTGGASAAHLGTHRKDAHFDAWMADKAAVNQAEINAIVKERAGIACDACRPAQVFPDKEALNLHNRVVHTAPEDEAAAVTARRPGEVDLA